MIDPAQSSRKVAMAIGAHPDDIEFQMAGTLLLLGRGGFETHYMNVSSGNCGSVEWPAKKTRAVRKREARRAAAILGAQFHPSLTDDLEIFYEIKTLRRLAAVIRDVRPGILLIHPPQDYMEDHTNACRLAVTAAFARGMPNFESIPSRPIANHDVTLYHCMPHGLRDPLRKRVTPGAFVNTTSVHETKRAALAAHRSQQGWLDASQKLNSYLQTMEEMSLELGRMSGRFRQAEGWRRHLHLGFCGAEADPLREALGRNFQVNPGYETALEGTTQAAAEL